MIGDEFDETFTPEDLLRAMEEMPNSLYSRRQGSGIPHTFLFRDRGTIDRTLDRIREMGVEVDVRPGNPTGEEVLGMEIRTARFVPEHVALVCDREGRPLYVIPLTEQVESGEGE